MVRIHTDLSSVAVSVAPSPATSGTSLGVTDANAAYLPDVYPYWATVVPAGQTPTRANSEIVKVTGGSSSAGTTTLTIVRAQGIPVTTAQTVTTSFDIYDANSSEALANANVLTVGGYPVNSTPTVNNIPVLDANLDIWAGAWKALGACTYEGADAPTYTFSLASDMTAILGVGMRIKLTDSTVKYFIITAVGAYSGGKTIITVFGGTDYTLSGGAITSPFYSREKAPFGFPLNPAKWTVSLSDTSSLSQTSPTNTTWYNLGSLTISIPIGVWNIDYQVCAYCEIASGGTSMYSTLSTTNNGESDTDFTVVLYITGIKQALNEYKSKQLVIASKTSYYLNAKTADNATLIRFFGSLSTTVIKAVSAYL